MIFIDEERVGKYLDKNNITSNQHALKYGIVLIKYYRNLGLNNAEIKEKLLEKIKIKNDDNGTISNYIYNTLVLNMNVCGEFKNKPIPITTKEMKTIKDLNDFKLEKFFFVMIVLCKSFNNMVRLQKKEVMRLSYLVENTKYFDKYFNKLLDLGYVDVGITKYKVKDEKKTMMYYFLTDKIYNPEDEDIALYIQNTNDPVLYYLHYYNYDNVEFCEVCGTPYIKSTKQTRGKKLCPSCKKEYQNEKSKICMRKKRAKNKNVNDQKID